MEDLKEQGLILYECISGSKAYGLATERSDTDIKGVFYLPNEQFYGLNYVEQIANATNDEVYYELGRYVELLLRNNPNILELLATPAGSILYRHPIMDKLTLRMFLSKLCRDSFAGYAIIQISKARGYKKKIVNPVDKERESVFHFCYVMKGHSSLPLQEWLADNRYRQEQCGLTSIPHSKGLYALFYDDNTQFHYKGIVSGEMANEVSLPSILKGEQEVAYLFFNKESYSSYCKEYRQYWDWVDNRNEVRYQCNKDHGKDYDAKNMMHTIRLLQVAEEILREGRLNVKRTNRDELLRIKSDAFEYTALLTMADAIMESIDTAYELSPLPDCLDRQMAELILVGMRNELYG